MCYLDEFVADETLVGLVVYVHVRERVHDVAFLLHGQVAALIEQHVQYRQGFLQYLLVLEMYQ